MAKNKLFNQEMIIQVKPDEATIQQTLQRLRSVYQEAGLNTRVTASGSMPGTILARSYGAGAYDKEKFIKATREAQGYGDAMKGVNKEHEKYNKHDFKKVIAWAIGWQIAYGAINAVKQAISDSITNFMNFEDTLNRIRIVNIESTEDYKKFGNAIFEIGKKFGISSKDVAEGSKSNALI
jgi:hypothetical protein